MDRNAGSDPRVKTRGYGLDGEPMLTFGKFNPGVEASDSQPARPCDDKFTDALIQDLALMSWMYFCETAENPLGVDLGNQSRKEELRQQTRLIMHQCRRLKATPELFSSYRIETNFLERLSRISKQIVSMQEANVAIAELDQDAASWELSEEQIARRRRLPYFHPDRADGKLPWNKWLENSAEVKAEWISIQQKIPRVGEKIFRQITLMYDEIQGDFRSGGLIITAPDNNQQLPSPGAEFEHMTVSGFCTIPIHDLGFKNGNRRKCDADGKVTLEYLSWLSSGMLSSGTGIEMMTKNCPYFRYAMAYPKKGCSE